MTHVFDVVKLGLTSTSSRSFAKRLNLAVLMIIMPCGYNSPNAQEPDEAKVSSPVLKQWPGGRPPGRL